MSHATGESRELHTLTSGLVFGESPRWRDERLWFVDFGADEVRWVDLRGRGALVARVTATPMGLGFMPDGRLLIVSMRDGKLLRREPDESLVACADLSAVSNHPWGEMVVDGRGNAYVGNIGFDFPGGEFAPGIVALVTPDGAVRQVADGAAFPNGMAVTPDNSTLILAESYAHRLTAFEIGSDGSLSNRRVWAELEGAYPDGICMDAEGAVWYSDVPGQCCVRVREGGEVLETVKLDRGCFACALGGPDNRTLFMMAAEYPPASFGPDAPRTGRIFTTRAPAAAAGWP